MNYYAVRFKSAPDQIRIEKADTPTKAFHLAFGMPPRTVKGIPSNAEYKDLGTRVRVIQSDRIAHRSQLLGRIPMNTRDILTSYNGTRFVRDTGSQCEHGVSLSKSCNKCIDEQRKIEAIEERRREDKQWPY